LSFYLVYVVKPSFVFLTSEHSDAQCPAAVHAELMGWNSNYQLAHESANHSVTLCLSGIRGSTYWWLHFQRLVPALGQTRPAI